MRKIAFDDDEPIARSTAARQWLETRGEDIANLEPFLRGESSLKALRASGVNTLMLKKASIKRDAEGGEHITVEVRDGGAALDRIADRTEGKPTQRLEVARAPRDPDDVRGDIAAMLQAHPEFIQRLQSMIGGPEIVADSPQLPG